MVTASLVAFALAIEQLGLVLSILLLIGIGSLAARGIKPWEALVAAAGLIVLSWAIFIVGPRPDDPGLAGLVAMELARTISPPVSGSR